MLRLRDALWSPWKVKCVQTQQFAAVPLALFPAKIKLDSWDICQLCHELEIAAEASNAAGTSS